MNLFDETQEIDSGATISECGLYRYRLWRIWDDNLPLCTWVMLNPSTADASEDDPTIRKCMGFARRWGHGGIQVVNLYAYRATDPKELKVAHRDGVDVVGPWATYSVGYAMGYRCPVGGRIVAAWGTKCRSVRPSHLRDRAVLKFLRRFELVEAEDQVLCLRRTNAGFPQHPLYVPYDTVPMPYGEAP